MVFSLVEVIKYNFINIEIRCIHIKKYRFSYNVY